MVDPGHCPSGKISWTLLMSALKRCTIHAEHSPSCQAWACQIVSPPGTIAAASCIRKSSPCGLRSPYWIPGSGEGMLHCSESLQVWRQPANAIIPEKHCMKCACRNLRIISSSGGMLHCPHSIQKLQHGHRFEEELYDMHLRKPEYMIVRGLKAECCIVHIYCSHKPEHGIQSLWRSTTWSPPAETCVYGSPSCKGMSPVEPQSFIPQAMAEPSLRRSIVFQLRAEIPVYDIPVSVSNIGILHCPWEFLPEPQHCHNCEGTLYVSLVFLVTFPMGN